MATIKDISNKIFGRLTTLKFIKTSKQGAIWLCRCECGVEVEVLGTSLRRGSTKSCGCLKSDLAKQRAYRENSYEIIDDLVIVKDALGNSFKISLSDLEAIKPYYWSLNDRGYVVRQSPTNIKLHRFLLSPPKNKVVDHINHDNTDNTRENLRICSISENNKNSRRYKNNTSGTTGVYKNGNKFMVIIKVDLKDKYLGLFNTFEEAVKVREKAELEYYGEFTNNKK